MPDAPQARPTLADYGEFGALALSYLRELRSIKRSKATLDTYRYMLIHWAAYQTSQGRPLELAAITRADCEAYQTHLHDSGHKVAGVVTRHAALKAYFRWLVEEGELAVSPMLRVRSPRLVETPPPVLTDAQVTAIIKVCQGRDFEDRRALAIVRLLLDTGLRVSELIGLTTATVDLDNNIVSVMGKGSKPRVVPFGAKAAAALDRYERERARHPLKALPAYWLGQRGGLSVARVQEILKAKAEAAGLEGRHYPHLWRHKFSADYLAAGGQESNLARINGWSSTKMVQRYGRATAVERAIAEHRRLSPGDRL